MESRDKDAKDIDKLREEHDYTHFDDAKTVPAPVTPEILKKKEQYTHMVESLYSEKSKSMDNLSKKFNKKKNKVSGLRSSLNQKNIKVEDLNSMIKIQREEIINQNKRWEEQQKIWREESIKSNHEINELKKVVEELKKEVTSFIGIVKERDIQISKLQDENAALRKESLDKDIALAHVRELLNKRTEKLKRKKTELNQTNAAIDQAKFAWKQPSSLPEGAKWKERDIVTGFKQTFFQEDYPIEKKQNDFRYFAYNGDMEGMKSMLEEDKTIINGRGMPDSFGSVIRAWQDKTPLMLAVQEGHGGCVKFLVACEAELNYLDRDGMTALDYAEANNYIKIAAFLKSKGAENGIYLMNALNQAKRNA